MPKAYYIKGHGENSPSIITDSNPRLFSFFNSPENSAFYEESFIVPPDCIIVVKAKSGEAAIGGLTSEIIRRLPTEVFENPIENQPKLIEAFGSLAFYLPGQRCPNFCYSVFLDFLVPDGWRGFSNSGSGIIDIDKWKGKYKLGSHNNVNKFNNIDEDLKQMFEISEYPTYSQIKEKFEEFKLTPTFNGYKDNLSMVIQLFKIFIQNTLWISQHKLCALFPGVHYNFICRGIDRNTMERLFNSSNLSSRTGYFSEIRTPLLYSNANYNAKSAIRDMISEAELQRKPALRSATLARLSERPESSAWRVRYGRSTKKGGRLRKYKKTTKRRGIRTRRVSEASRFSNRFPSGSAR